MIISQLGYDSRLPRYALWRQCPGERAAPPCCDVLDRDERVLGQIAATVAGHAWGDHYTTYDLAGLGAGRFRLRYQDDGRTRVSEWFDIGPGQFFSGAWQRLHFELCIRFMENELPNGGYMDCGSPLREVTSHCVTGLALDRCLSAPIMDPRTAVVLSRHLREIASYIRACRVSPGVYAHEAEGGSGELHQWCREMRLLHDSAYAGLLHLAAWRHFRTPADLDDARACAERLLEDLPREAARRLTPNPSRPESRRYEPWMMYELPTDMPLPAEYRTPILMRTVELCRSLYEADGGEVFREGAARYLGVLEGLQIRQGTWQGDFLAWPGLDRRQKIFEDSWSGCSKGCVHGHTLGGLTVMAASDDPLAATARDMLARYLDGFFLPLTRRNPFALPANGIATDGEPRWFAGMRHAMNGTYALLWADVLRAADALGRPAPLDDAARIALWFAGVHPGVREQASQAWHGMSCHYGPGLHAATCWSHMPNAVSNGFAAGPQFQLLPLGGPDEDAPRHWHDEDWILHGAAIVELLTEIEQRLPRQG